MKAYMLTEEAQRNKLPAGLRLRSSDSRSRQGRASGGVKINRVVALKNFRRATWRAERPKSACLRSSGARPSFALFSVASHCCAGNFSERLFLSPLSLRQRKWIPFGLHPYDSVTDRTKVENPNINTYTS